IGETEVSNLKVEVRDVPPELTVQYEPESVKVTLRGRKDLLPGIQPQVWVQANVSEGDHWLPVQVLVPSGIEVVKVEPAEVTVRLRKPNGSR
ncbi:MAG TPA: hypothetical protein GX513_06860, partial [Firmicutes bacterium]|nr:hypothetical protein [Bacillota bacterium]